MAVLTCEELFSPHLGSRTRTFCAISPQSLHRICLTKWLLPLLVVLLCTHWQPSSLEDILCWQVLSAIDGSAPLIKSIQIQQKQIPPHHQPHLEGEQRLAFLNNNWDRDFVPWANVHTLSLGCHSRGTSNQERRLSFVHKGQNDIEDINCQTQNEVKKCQQHGTTDNTWRDCSAVMSLNQTLREAEYHISPSLYPSIPWRGDWLCNSTPNTSVCPKCQMTKGNYLNLDKTMSKGLNSRGANWTLFWRRWVVLSNHTENWGYTAPCRTPGLATQRSLVYSIE